MPLLLTHPKMRWRGRPNVPFGFHAGGCLESRGIFEGTLHDVTLCQPDSSRPVRLELVVRYEGTTYSTLVYFDDEVFARALCDTLARHTGQPMVAIWGLEVDG